MRYGAHLNTLQHKHENLNADTSKQNLGEGEKIKQQQRLQYIQQLTCEFEMKLIEMHCNPNALQIFYSDLKYTA